MSVMKSYVIGSGAEGYRLDKALHTFMPGAGLRLRRRLCDDGRVLVDGRARNAGYKVRSGQQVEIIQGNEVATPQSLGLKIVRQDEMFAAISKPGGVHSASIAGRDEPCVEAILPDMFPNAEPALLNRLDNLTSGLLVVALTPEAKLRYQEFEDAGEIRKFYLAVVVGRLDGIVSIRKQLDTDNRKKTKVLDDNDADMRRWTDVTSLAHDHSADTTLVRCLIMKGARHQIRAHLASIGHPIVGDPLYGIGREGLRLHHHQIEFPGFRAESTPLF